jgi:hypothetical protein
MEQVIGNITERLENLPLDLQTGKDKQAAETVQFFTGITEKLFRIYSIIDTSVFPAAQITVVCASKNNEKPMNIFLEEFNSTLQEMLAAYEQKDSVLLGDLAEYEMAPRLRSFYTALRTQSSRIPPDAGV